MYTLEYDVSEKRKNIEIDQSAVMKIDVGFLSITRRSVYFVAVSTCCWRSINFNSIQLRIIIIKIYCSMSKLNTETLDIEEGHNCL